MAAKRTLIYTAWDGEEPGLIGSTEWAETHAQELGAHAAVYVNTDETGRGFLGAGGSHSLEELVNDVAKDITDPETKVSVWKRQQAALLMGEGRRRGSGGKDLLNRSTLPLEAIGSGSDFGAFLDHLGVASLNLGFGGEDRSGTYHSAYDTPWFEDKFGDKDDIYGPVLAQTAGTLVMRLATADILPYDFKILADTVKAYGSELKSLVKSLQDDATTRKRNIDMGLYALTNDPQAPVHAPGLLPPPPNLDFSGLDDSITNLEKAAAHFSEAEGTIAALPADRRKSLNAELALTERKLISEQGLPRRPWVRHLLYAPGTYTGYGAKTIPGVREALEQGRYQEAQEQLVVVTKALLDEGVFIDHIATELVSASR
jgi:N-acetylated-alpha-linked acidic dipeptidase